MSGSWTPDELARIDASEELEIATRRVDGTLRSWTPIWVVCVGSNAYVRTWHRRENGWFGRAVALGRARIRVPGVEVDVVVADLGDEAAPRAGVDEAYQSKYGRYGAATFARMVSDEAAATTLRLTAAR